MEFEVEVTKLSDIDKKADTFSGWSYELKIIFMKDGRLSYCSIQIDWAV
jgi:hypothetical protein